VQELNGGTSGGGFSYRVVARPKTDRKMSPLPEKQFWEISQVVAR